MRDLERRMKRLEERTGGDMAGNAYVWRDEGQSEEEALASWFGDGPRPAQVQFCGWLPTQDSRGHALELPPGFIQPILREVAARGRPRPKGAA